MHMARTEFKKKCSALLNWLKKCFVDGILSNKRFLYNTGCDSQIAPPYKITKIVVNRNFIQ